LKTFVIMNIFYFLISLLCFNPCKHISRKKLLRFLIEDILLKNIYRQASIYKTKSKIYTSNFYAVIFLYNMPKGGFAFFDNLF